MRNPSEPIRTLELIREVSLEATYEESKQRPWHLRRPGFGGLEATYEESKHVYPGVLVGPQALVWKLPMRNPSDVTLPWPPSVNHVWKLPMRNPSVDARDAVVRAVYESGSYL